MRSDRWYHFALEPGELWAILIKTKDYQAWWPWLRSCDAMLLEEGERWSCVVQPPLPYAVRFELLLDVVVDACLVAASVDGDVVGDARLEITSTDAGCDLHFLSRLAPANALLRAVARVARPVAQFGHDWVLDSGFRQFSSSALP